MKTNENHSRRVLLLGIFAAAAVVVFLLNIALGSVSISMSEILGIFTGSPDVAETNRAIVQNIRLPRTLATVIGGAALAAAGVLLQVFFNNPIVEPYVLGISSGSTLFVGLVTLGGFSFGMKSIPPMGMVAGAFIGAMAVMLCVIWASRKVKSISTLLIIGLMAGFVCSAVTSMLSALADKEKVTGFYRWSLGSFAGITWEQVAVLYVVGIPFLAAALFMGKSLNSMMLGERYAKSMGVGIQRFRIMIVFISSVLTALVTAFAGPISFVGLAVPHIVRMLLKTSDNRVVLPAVCICGALMTGICDLGTRLLLSPVELPLSALTSVVGAPLVVFLLIRQKGQEL